jgi:vitamin B12 transporter
VIRRPRNELGLGATWQPQGSSTQLSADLRHVRGLYDDQFWVDGKTGARLPDFTVMNFAATQPITSNVELTARMTNAFDEEYSEVWGYATRGRAGFVGLSASW